MRISPTCFSCGVDGVAHRLFAWHTLRMGDGALNGGQALRERYWTGDWDGGGDDRNKCCQNNNFSEHCDRTVVCVAATPSFEEADACGKREASARPKRKMFFTDYLFVLTFS